MNPVTVLKETMRAAGDPNLSQWHEDLVANGKSARDIESVSYLRELQLTFQSLTSKTQKRDTLRRQVEELEPDVRNFERRQDLQKQVSRVKLMPLTPKLDLAEVELQAMQWKEYTAVYSRHREATKKVKARMHRLEAKHEPLNDLKE